MSDLLFSTSNSSIPDQGTMVCREVPCSRSSTACNDASPPTQDSSRSTRGRPRTPKAMPSRGMPPRGMPPRAILPKPAVAVPVVPCIGSSLQRPIRRISSQQWVVSRAGGPSTSQSTAQSQSMVSTVIVPTPGSQDLKPEPTSIVMPSKTTLTQIDLTDDNQKVVSISFKNLVSKPKKKKNKP